MIDSRHDTATQPRRPASTDRGFESHTDDPSRARQYELTNSVAPDKWVRETRFGRWFQSTEVWRRYVIEPAMQSLVGMLDGCEGINRVLDLGCGHGFGVELIQQNFAPDRIVAVDIDEAMLSSSRQRVAASNGAGAARLAEGACACDIRIVRGDAVRIEAPDGSFDLVLCHQLLHHVADQQAVLREIRRVLRPGGIVLIGETCKRYIRMPPVRILFRHPMHVQKNAAEYISLVREMGFHVAPGETLAHSPWWSLWHLGLRADRHEHTEILIVARKP